MWTCDVYITLKLNIYFSCLWQSMQALRKLHFEKEIFLLCGMASISNNYKQKLHVNEKPKFTQNLS
jgi:hypothetical protein